MKKMEAMNKNDSWNFNRDLATDKEAFLSFQIDIYFKSHHGKMWP